MSEHGQTDRSIERGFRKDDDFVRIVLSREHAEDPVSGEAERPKFKMEVNFGPSDSVFTDEAVPTFQEAEVVSS
jgi:hypothetical protein